MTTVERGGMRDQKYAETRPRWFFLPMHWIARYVWPRPMYELVRIVLTPLLMLCRVRYIGLENVPRQGRCLLVANHYSFLDHFLIAWRIKRMVRFMGKSQMFRILLFPLLFVYVLGGVFPIRRGIGRDEDSMTTARRLLRKGFLVCIYGGKGRVREGSVEKQKVGYAPGELSIGTRTPMIPVAILGSEGARNWKRFKIPVITVVIGRPMYSEYPADSAKEHGREETQRVMNEVYQLIRQHELAHLARWRGLFWI